MKLSTRQGRSGLGLEAQRAAVQDYVRAGGEVIVEYTEVETGKKDSIENRPELQRALRHAKRSRATLVVAKFDRLTRSVAVTSMLHVANVADPGSRPTHSDAIKLKQPLTK